MPVSTCRYERVRQLRPADAAPLMVLLKLFADSCKQPDLLHNLDWPCSRQQGEVDHPWSGITGRSALLFSSTEMPGLVPVLSGMSTSRTAHLAGACSVHLPRNVACACCLLGVLQGKCKSLGVVTQSSANGT